MGCLFGYCGRPAPGLLKKMAEILGHRCIAGWEHSGIDTGHDFKAEIGRGIAPWSHAPQTSRSIHGSAFGYSGVILNSIRVTPEEENERAKKLLHLLSDNFENGLKSLEGAFTCALAKEKEIHLLRDPSGVKVLYWTRNKHRLVFASEIKALFADSLVKRKMRTGALQEYLTFSFVPGERTMFEDIYELQPGTLLKYKNETVRTSRHFLFEKNEYRESSALSRAEYVEMVKDDLGRSVQECCRLEKRAPAVFLSGGIDSSAVLALAAHELQGTPLKTFSVHFGSKYANENEFVSMMTKRYNTDHTWLKIKPKGFIKEMEDIIWKLDDPIGDPITVPNFMMARAASKVTGVVLNGEGGDPCFGGPKNIPMMLSRLYGPGPGNNGNAWLEREYLLSYKKCFSDLGRMLTPDTIRDSGGEEALTDILTPYFNGNSPRHFLNKLMTINIRLKAANLIMVKVDKMTSANGILAMPPLFSKRIIQSSLKCPPGLKLEGNIEKAVLKRAVEDMVPAPIVLRPKSGMMVPVSSWFRKDMRRYAKKVLSRKRLAEVGFFNIDYIEKIMKYDTEAVADNRFGLKLWMLITFMLWYEQMVKGKPINI